MYTEVKAPGQECWNRKWIYFSMVSDLHKMEMSVNVWMQKVLLGIERTLCEFINDDFGNEIVLIDFVIQKKLFFFLSVT